MYYLDVISLEGCPYSMNTEKIMEKNNIRNNLVKVNRSEKESYKNENIRTFPQIYLKKYNSSGSVLLGGNNDLEEIISLRGNNLEVQKKHLEKKYNKISKKIILRIIELINVN